MPSHKDLLRQRFDSAEHAYTEAVNESTRLDDQLKAARKTVDELTDKYNTACRHLAAGAAGAEPAAILAERDQHSHRIIGLEGLLKAANDAVVPLHDERQAAGIALQAELDREELERLEGVIVEANRKQDDAKAVFDHAQKTASAAVWARARFLRQLELKAKGVA